jgi:transcriptional regulator with XRE-family HTH domain
MPLSPTELESVALGWLLNRIRSDESTSVRDLERRLGKTRGWLSNRLRGFTPMGLGHLFQVLAELEIDPREFWDRVLPGSQKEYEPWSRRGRKIRVQRAPKPEV